MKSIIITTTVIVLSINSVSAQKVKEAEVPKPILTAFQTQFKDAKLEAWDKEKNGEFEAEFTINNVKMSANFSADGELVGTEEEINSTALPKMATDYLAKNYIDNKIEKTTKITGPTGNISFELEVKKGNEKKELLFSSRGGFIKEVFETTTENKKD